MATGNAESLLQHDQLLKNLANNQSFRLRSFKEAPIRFPPTYKYVCSIPRFAVHPSLTFLIRCVGTTPARTSTTRRRSGGYPLGAIVSCGAPTVATTFRPCTINDMKSTFRITNRSRPPSTSASSASTRTNARPCGRRSKAHGSLWRAPSSRARDATTEKSRTPGQVPWLRAQSQTLCSLSVIVGCGHATGPLHPELLHGFFDS